MSVSFFISWRRPAGRRGMLSIVSTALIAAGLVVPVLGTAPASAAESDPFTIVLVPDTQNYTYSNRTAYLNEQMDWIISTKDQLNTKFVAHLGDLVSEYDNTTQWAITSNAMKKIDDAGIPNSVIPGNHDFNTATREFSQYNSYFPVSRYSQASWNSDTARYSGYLGQNQFGTDGADRQNMDSYTLLTAGGRDFIILNLEFEAPTYALDWADKVLAAHPNRIAIMITHSFITLDGSRRTTPQSTGGTAPSAMWSNFVSQHCQIKMVLSGHEHNGDLGEARRTDNNVCGQPVHQLLSDFQDRANGGNGWLRYLTFDPAAGTVTAKTYSTRLQQSETDPTSEFTLPFPLSSDPPSNIAPIADISVLSTSDRTVSLSASTSSDVDGTITSYAWKFGDGTTGTGVTPAPHTYAADGTYPVTLTVTDDDSATATATKSVTVSTTPPPSTIYAAADAFSRTTSTGWGNADTGGAWTTPSGSTALSVSGGSGVVALTPSQTRESYLNSVSETSTITNVQVSSDVVPTGGAASATVIGRSTSQHYGARVRFEPGGVLRLYLLRGETSLTAGAGAIAAGSYAPGQVVNVRLSVRGTNPTTLAAKFWKVGTTEPAAWQLEATDSTAALQSAGTVGVRTSLSGSATVATDRVRYDNLTVSTGQAQPPANVPPVARFTTTTDGLTVNADGGTSTDSDGTISSYAWTFGTTGTGTGTTSSYTFPAAGTHPVTLKVTDNDGATHTTSQNITVTATAPPGSGVLAADAFARTVSNGWGTADTGGTWTTAGGSAALAVSGGQGVITLPKGETREARLEGVTGTNVEASVLFSSNVASAGGAASLTLIGRRVGTSSYGARARLEPGGVMRMYLLRDETALGTYVLPGTYTAGDQLKIKVSVTGTSPTTVRGKIWRAGATEPSSWQATGTDSTAALQVAGHISLRPSVSGTSTVASTILRFDDLRVTAP